MKVWFRKRFAVITGGAIVLVASAFFINARITSWIQGPGFKELLDRETSKGLKLQANYGTLERDGLWGLKTDSFHGDDGSKTIISMEAHDITGAFNPLGVILRYWEIDSLHLKTGTVMLQKTEAPPAASNHAPWPPWWGLVWPYRVYLADVQVDDANILWKLRDKESGIYGTHLEITPNWKDFEYEAHDGDFKTPLTPTLKVIHAHVLIRRSRLYCSEFILGDDPAHPEEQLRMSGDAGLQDDRSIRLKIDLADLKVAPWLPEKYRANVEGRMRGHFDYTSTGTGLETGKGTGNFQVMNGVLRHFEPIHKFVTITGSPDPGDMALKICRADLHWEMGAVSAENMEIECENVFRLTGTLKIAADKSLSGQVELGVAEPYLRWLPTARSNIFTRLEGGYYFTTIHFSGTAQKPQQDLTPRILHEIGKSPTLAVKLFFNELTK